MIHIFTSVVNRPDFLEYQLQSLNKFVKDDFTFHAVYDNGIDSNVLEKFKEVCSAGIVLHEADDRVMHPNPSTCISLVVDWIFKELMLKEYKDDICVVLDADMFLIDELNIEEYIGDYPILGIPQNREHVYYITNQLMVFNMPKIISIDTDIDFMDGGLLLYHRDDGRPLRYNWIKPTLKNVNLIWKGSVSLLSKDTLFTYSANSFKERKARVPDFDSVSESIQDGKKPFRL